MKFFVKACTTFACVCLLLGAWAIAQASPQTTEASVQQAMERAFAQLRSGDYAALYEALPAASQRRITRERFTSALNRSRRMYELDRMEIGAIGVAGNVAAIDTTIYGRVLEPVQGEGKIEVRQYLMRETGRWRVVTDDPAAVRRLLAANKSLARRFPTREPQVSVKRDGRWVGISR